MRSGCALPPSRLAAECPSQCEDQRRERYATWWDKSNLLQASTRLVLVRIAAGRTYELSTAVVGAASMIKFWLYMFLLKYRTSRLKVDI